MKKVIVIACVVAFVIGITVISFAQDADKPMMGKGMMGKGMMMKGGMMGMCPMHGMMMGKGGMVATPEGGVIVMAGNKLYKYDKDLNLVKEAEVKMDMAATQRMMSEMKQGCPMCQEMMAHCGMMGEEQKEPVKTTKQ